MPPDATSPTPAADQRLSWAQTLRVYLEPASLRMFALGFSAGLPLLLVLGTLSFRLREAGIDRTTIGYLSWVGLAYGFKWCWAPLVDRLPIPLLTRALGRRRSWLLLSQLCIAAALVATVAGLGVAIPALFGYNYLQTKIKTLSNDMTVFVDEFVTRMAETYGD